MANIRINDLPSDSTPSSADVIPLDNGSTRKTTIQKLVEVGRPVASQAEAEAGVNATKAMTPLTTKQAISAQGTALFASAAQGALANTAVQPGDLGAVATTNDYGDLDNLPTLGTMAAEDAGDYSPIAQAVPAGGTTGQVLAKVSNTDNDLEWTDAGIGDMLASVYDPDEKEASPFDLGNADDETLTRPKMVPYIWKSIAPTPEEYGAEGDGVTDDTDAVQDAINAGNRLVFDKFSAGKVYRITAPLEIDSYDYTFDGTAGLTGGVSPGAKFLIDHTDGTGLWLKKAAFHIRGLWLVASDARNAAAIGGGNVGLQIGVEGDYVGVGRIERSLVQRHPDEGVLGVARITGLTCFDVRSQFNRHHGWRFSNGSTEGYGTTGRPGIISLIHCRSEENGGNALYAFNSASPGSAYRILAEQWECYNNAWNSEISGLANYDIVLSAQNAIFRLGATGEPLDISRTTLTNGDACYAKASKSGGFSIRDGCRDIHIDNWRFSDNSSMVQCDDSSIIGLKITDPYTDATLPVAIGLGTNTTGVDIKIPKINTLTVPIRSKSTSPGKAVLDGVEYELYGNASNPRDVHFAPRGIATVEIGASGVLQAKTGTVRMVGEGNVEDTLSSIYFAASGTQYHRDGTEIRLVNKNAYNIFVSVLGNIRTKTGAQVTLAQNRALTVVADSGVYYEV